MSENMHPKKKHTECTGAEGCCQASNLLTIEPNGAPSLVANRGPIALLVCPKPCSHLEKKQMAHSENLFKFQDMGQSASPVL